MRVGWVLFVVFCVAASVLVPVGGPAAGAQSQTSWYVNDNPELNGPSQYWWAGDAGKGYGSNDYVYTYGIAGESSADNWARWLMGSRVGRQELQVYVPNTKAAATVVYRIDVGGSRYTKRIVQRTAYGWTALGTYNADGASVSIRLRDNDASQHWKRDGYSASRIGVDAIRMRCVARCSTTQPTPVPTAAPAPQIDEPSSPRSVRATADADSVSVSWSAPSDDGGAAVSGYRVDLYRGSSRVDRKNVSASSRSASFAGLAADTAYQVRVWARNSVGYSGRATASARTDAVRVVRSVSVSLGADRAGCQYSSLPCRWVSASYSGFSAGSYRVQCYWSSSSGSLGTRTASFSTSRVSGTNAELCWFNVQPGRYLTAVVDGVRSNTIVFAGTVQATRPSAPRTVSATGAAGSVSVSWGPPADDGGAAILGYRVDLYRGSSRVDRKNVAASARSASFAGLAADTAYQVRVSAQNSVGRGPEATASARTDRPAPRRPGAPGVVGAVVDVDSIGVVWSPPADDGGAAVTGYRVDLYRGSSRVDTKSTSAAAREATFGGLAADTAYQFRISARNSAGAGAEAVGNTRTIPPQKNKPSAPRSVSATGAAGSVSVSWSAPSDDGGAAILGYRVDLYRGSSRVDRKNVASSARSASFAGLAADTAYQARVSAQNSAGRGPEATASARTDAVQEETDESEPGVPSAPRNMHVTASENSVSVSWVPPAGNGGNPVTGYQIELHRGSTPADTKSTSASTRQTTFTNLSPDTPYTVLVSAENSQGLSSPQIADFITEAVQEERKITIALGAYRSGSDCKQRSNPCRWVRATYTGFDGAPYSASCYSSTSSTSLEKLEASFTARTAAGSDSTLCWFNVQPGRYLTAMVDGVRSNTIMFAGDSVAQRAQPPAPPRNLGATILEDGSIRTTWDPPANSGSSSIRHYRVEYSRPAIGSSEPWSTSTIVTGTAHTWFGNRKGITYTVKVTAINHDSLTSASITVLVTDPHAPPTEPQDVKVELVDSSDDSNGIEEDLKISWSPPNDTNGSPVIQYKVCLSRGPIHRGPNKTGKPWSDCSTISQTQFTHIHDASQCAKYQITVSAGNRHGWGPAAQYKHKRSSILSFLTTTSTTSTISTPCILDVLEAPVISLKAEGRKLISLEGEGEFLRVFNDNPDLNIKWTAISGATGYHIDWRYLDYDIEALRAAIEKNDNRAFDREIEGQEVGPSQIDNDFKPRTNGNPEAFCRIEKKNFYNNKRESYCIWTKGGEYKTFNKDEPEFKIDGVNQGYNIQVRVRGLVDDDRYEYYGEWSPWTYLTNEWLGLVCTALDVYENIEDVKQAAEIVGWALIVGGVIVTAATAGAGASAGGAAVAAKAALSEAAKQAVRLLVKHVTVKKVIKIFIKELAKNIVENWVKGQIRYIFKCIGQAGELSDSELIELGGEMFRELQPTEPDLVDIDLDDVILNLRDVLS